MKSAALTGLAFHPDVASHQANQARRDGQAEAGTAVLPRGRTVRLGEGFEDQFLLFGGNSNAGVGHAEVKDCLVGAFGFHRNPHGDFAPGGKLQGISNQIDDNLSQPVRVSDQRVGQIEGNVAGELQALLLRPNA